MRQEIKEKCIYICSNYGIEKQSLKACEELGELARAISRICFKFNEETLDNLEEEIADVLIMIEQLKWYYPISDIRLESIINSKVNRQLKRIEEE